MILSYLKLSVILTKDWYIEKCHFIRLHQSIFLKNLNHFVHILIYQVFGSNQFVLYNSKINENTNEYKKRSFIILRQGY